MRRLLIGILGLIVLAVLFFVLCTFIQRPYEVIILDRAGSIVEHPTHIAYSLYFCLPTDKVVPIDTRLHMFQSITTQINTKDKEPIMVRIFAAWRVDRAHAVRFYSHLSRNDDRAKDFIGQKITGVTGAVVGQHTMDDLYNVDEKQVKMREIEDQIIQTANLVGATNEGLAAQGIEITQVGFSRFAFSPDNADSVYRRMVSERQVQAINFRTKGESERSRLEAEGEQEAQKIRSEADAKAQKIRGEGAAQAIQIIGEVQRDPETQSYYSYWKKMELLGKAMTNKTYLIMTPEDPLIAPIYKFASGGGTIPAATQPARPSAIDPAKSTAHDPIEIH